MAGQHIKWYVTDGAATPTIQPLAIGTERQNGTWTISLPSEFNVSSNVALLYGKKVIEPQQLASWVTNNVYAPSEATYADVSSHKIVCEIYTNNEGSGNPNARYTFSIHKGFAGTLKSGVTETTERVLLTAGEITHTIEIPVHIGTKYSRFYLTDAKGTPVNPTGKLTVTDSDPVLNTVDGYDVSLGRYRYIVDGSLGWDVIQPVTLTLTAAELDQYRIVAVFSGDAAVITPLPAIMIATWDENQNPDVMMAAWGGQCGPKHITFQLSAHKTTENIRLKKAFTISFATKDDIVQSDYFGIVSGNDVPDKVAKAGFTITKSPNVDAPIINEYKLTLECKVVTFDENENGGARVVGEIVNMSADESILDEEGNIDLGKLQPVIFDSAKRTYRVVGEKVGDAWGSGKTIIEKEVK